MSPVNSICCLKKKKKKIIGKSVLKWPISIIGKMLNIGADNRSTPSQDAPDTTGLYEVQLRLRPPLICSYSRQTIGCLDQWGYWL